MPDPTPAPPDRADAASVETGDKPTLSNATGRILEALLFAADRPLSSRALAQVMGERIDGTGVRRLIGELNAAYAAQERAFEIREIAGGFQMLTRAEFARWVRELHKHRRRDTLTPAAVETLAIVAYRQPILRAKIDDIRGVQSGPMLRSLVERGLVKVVGVKDVPGHPKLYGTTRAFLDHFNLKSLKELPGVDALRAEGRTYSFK
jgi:segregation and condensation protein B